jgi:hypothetical protein
MAVTLMDGASVLETLTCHLREYASAAGIGARRLSRPIFVDRR